MVMSAQQLYARRRHQLMKQLGEDAIAIIPGATSTASLGQLSLRFRQESHFYYLTGFNEADAVVVLLPGRREGDTILFSQPADPKRAVWEGPRIGQQGACEDYGAAQAYPLSQLNDIIPDLLKERACLYYPLGRDAQFDQQIMRWLTVARQK